MRGIGWFVEEATAGDPADYVLAGVEQVATELPAAHYYLVSGRLAMFVQARLEEAPAKFALASAVQDAAVAALAARRIPDGSKFVVVDTPFELHYWEVTPHLEGAGSGLEGALERLAGG